MLRSEGSMGLLAVAAYSNDLGTEVLEFFVRVPKLTRLSSASFRKVFRIEVDDYVFVSTKVFEANILAIASLESESRSQTT